jgi:hypothetical protein
MRMKGGRKPDPPADTSWQESRLPGERSGEGVKDIWKHVERDIRRRLGLPPKDKSQKKP